MYYLYTLVVLFPFQLMNGRFSLCYQIKKIICPNNLINVAKKTGIVDAAIVNAGEIFPMESVHKAVQHNLINPTIYW